MNLEKRSPCYACKRVEDPDNCTDKSCRVWQAWFLEKWEQTRGGFRQLKEQPESGVGVELGGNRYAAPHQVRAYLRQDPCGSCTLPRELCTAPCRKRRVWEDCVREER